MKSKQHVTGEKVSKQHVVKRFGEDVITVLVLTQVKSGKYLCVFGPLYCQRLGRGTSSSFR